MMGALQVDDQPEVGGYSVGAFTQLSLPLNLFIGGVSDMKDVSRDASLTQSFSGCVQRVVQNGRTINLLEEALFGVNVADCPHPCTSEPCQRGGRCEPVLDSYMCHCPLGPRWRELRTWYVLIYVISPIPQCTRSLFLGDVTLLLLHQ